MSVPICDDCGSATTLVTEIQRVGNERGYVFSNARPANEARAWTSSGFPQSGLIPAGHDAVE